ncbi:MAG: O-antigen ligase family protein [Nitrospirae bacterium]|nr:O-antigen ligase family protein [Nitrospirota bacterium]
MPPKIALILCIIFIVYLFRIDIKRDSKVSYALWIPLIWLLITGSRPISLWLNLAPILDSPDDYLEGSPVDRALYFGLILAGLFILLKRKILVVQFAKDNPWIFLYFLYGFISILWSDYPLVSFKRWIKFAIGNSIMVLIILSEHYPLEAIKTLIRRCAYVLIPLSIVLYKYYPHLGRRYHSMSGKLTITGVSYSSNLLGTLCLICGFVLVWNLLSIWKERKISSDKKKIYAHILLLAMTFWLLWNADAATSSLSLIAGMCVMLGLRMPAIRENIQSIGRFITVIFFLFLPLIFLVDFSAFLSASVDVTGHSQTFWGRTQLWKELITMVPNPLTGVGFESFWLGDRIAKLWEKHWWRPTEAHNGYIEIYLNLGWIGLFLLAGFIVSAYGKIRRLLLSDFDYGRFQMGFFIMIILYNITEAAFKGIHLMFIFLLFIGIEYPRLHQKSLNEHD